MRDDNRYATAIVDCLEPGILATDSCGYIAVFNQTAKKALPRLIQGIHISELFGAGTWDTMRNIPGGNGELTVQTGHSHLQLNIRALHLPLDEACGFLITLGQVEHPLRPAAGPSAPRAGYTINDLLGDSQAMRRLREQAQIVAAGTSTILIRGESGTGKEMLARAIHNLSPRFSGPFVTINCSAIPEELLESELFGYEEGAFSGARVGGKIGKFQSAHKGTLFLDEIGDMSLFLQAKLLRVLQERQVERIGSVLSTPVDVRIIAATHRNLEEMLSRGEFREDLFYRINVIPLETIPLRDRKSDLVKLCDYFVEFYNRQLHKQGVQVSGSFRSSLENYAWPGNVRELQNAIEYAMNLIEGDILAEEHLPARIRNYRTEAKDSTFNLAVLERETIRRCLNEFGTTVQGKEKAARVLGIGLATLYRKLNHYALADC